eukprot:scaffold1882_cov23-Cyclotella_meneghiniana.AAC.1
MNYISQDEDNADEDENANANALTEVSSIRTTRDLSRQFEEVNHNDEIHREARLADFTVRGNLDEREVLTRINKTRECQSTFTWKDENRSNLFVIEADHDTDDDTERNVIVMEEVGFQGTVNWDIYKTDERGRERVIRSDECDTIVRRDMYITLYAFDSATTNITIRMNCKNSGERWLEFQWILMPIRNLFATRQSHEQISITEKNEFFRMNTMSVRCLYHFDRIGLSDIEIERTAQPS